jgi:septation ring formation regulator EzrA
MKELRELRKELDAAIKPGQAEVVDRLFDLLEKQVKRGERLEKENERLRRRIAELEKRDPPAAEQEAKAPDESYSLDAEEKRRRRKQRKRKAAPQRNARQGASRAKTN